MGSEFFQPFFIRSGFLENWVATKADDQCPFGRLLKVPKNMLKFLEMVLGLKFKFEISSSTVINLGLPHSPFSS